MKIRDELKWVLPLVLACILVFANSLGGEFVYDDTRQIARNSLIQNNALVWNALTSDVWAFKGDGTQAASNYWRPTFTFLNIVCFRLFGLNPVGWHVVNVMLHIGVCLLGFFLLRRWQFSSAVAFVIVLLFAVHPTRVESVAWVAGSPDLLFAMALFGSLWFATSYRTSRSNKHLLLMGLFYLIALGAKEVAILCLPIYYFVLADGSEDEADIDSKVPLLAIASAGVLYFVVRLNIIGAVALPPTDAVETMPAILSVPLMFAFYLKQIFLPYSIAINYPIGPVIEIGATNFLLPLTISLVALGGLVYFARKSSKARIAAAIFLLPLAPAMNAMAFPSDQLVHDRYLYLPLFGVLMLIIPFAARFISDRILLIVGCIIAMVFAFQTVRYNSAWNNELALWTWTRSVDTSPMTALQLGSALSEVNRYDEAIVVYSEAINTKPSLRSYYGRGRNLNALKRYEEAEKDLLLALGTPDKDQDAYAMYQVYESLGITYLEQRKYEQAIRNFLEARKQLPIYAAALTEKLAVVHYQAGNKSDALRELEANVVQSRRELLPESKNVVFRLGLLYIEQGRKEEARGALSEYLRSTASFSDKSIVGYRNQAMRALEGLR